MALVNSISSRTLKTSQGGVVLEERIERQKSVPRNMSSNHLYMRRTRNFPMSIRTDSFASYGMQNWVHDAHTSDVQYSGHGQIAYNKAYAKFIDLIGPKAEWGTGLVEFKKTQMMVNSRVLQLARGVNALRRGRFGDFLKVFNITPQKRDRGRRYNKPAQAGGLWLEYWMGWAPTVGDAYAGMEVLTAEIPNKRIKARGHSSQALTYYYAWGNSRFRATTTLKHGVQLLADVRLVNPNLFLLNQLGLANPALIFHDVMPWSWLLGWFQNLRDVIASWTDFVGLEITNHVMTRRLKYSGTVDYHQQPYSTLQGVWRAKPFGTVIRRTLPASFQGPSFQLKPVRALSWTRGLTSISLLLQRLNQIAPRRT